MARIVDNSGETPEDAVVILDARSTAEGIAAEYAYLEKRYGKRNVDWRLHSQELYEAEGRLYDIITVETGPEAFHDVYFDITGFFGGD